MASCVRSVTRLAWIAAPVPMRLISPYSAIAQEIRFAKKKGRLSRAALLIAVYSR